MNVKTVATLSALMLCLATGPAFAGKAERDLKKKVTKEALVPAAAAIKAACKCATALKVNWGSFKVVKQMGSIKYELGYVGKVVSKFCKSDKESRGLYCKHVKAIEIMFHAKSSPETIKKGKTIIVKTCKDMNSAGYGVKRIIEKF